MTSSPTQPPTARRTAVALIAVALALTILNGVKPLHIDDTFILRVAQQIAADPGDPYGFDIFWLQWPQPVYEELTPPVLPYWWSAALVLFGEQVLLWKLWLFPFALLLTWSVYSLLRRFASGLELPLAAMTVLSPAVLPGFNLMQDVPAQALGLAALALFLRAGDRSVSWLAVASGLLAGMAMQTKYTAVAVLAAMLVHALLFRRVRPAAVSVPLALALFFGWESFMALTYGQSMFVGQVRFGQFWYPRHLMVVPLLQLLGGLLPAVALVAVSGLRARRAPVSLLALGLVVLFGLFFVFPLEGWSFHLLGLLVGIALGLAIRRLYHQAEHADAASTRALWFLTAWLCVEVGVYFATSPFPAARRVLGIVVVATLLVGRLAAPHGGRLAAKGVRLAAGVGIALGLVYQVADVRDAQAQREAVHRATRMIGQADDDPEVWFVGHWGFQYYAERAGMRAVVPDRSLLAPGDWLVVPDGVHRQEIVLTADDAWRFGRIRVEDRLPIATGFGYYGGVTPEAGGSAVLRHLSAPRLEVSVLRIKRELVPQTAWPTARITDFALRAGGSTAAAAVPALVGRLRSGGAEDRRLALEGLAGLGSRAIEAVPALAAALFHRDRRVRHGAAVALGRIGPGAGGAVEDLEASRADPDPAVRRAVEQALERIRER